MFPFLCSFHEGFFVVRAIHLWWHHSTPFGVFFSNIAMSIVLNFIAAFLLHKNKKVEYIIQIHPNLQKGKKCVSCAIGDFFFFSIHFVCFSYFNVIYTMCMWEIPPYRNCRFRKSHLFASYFMVLVDTTPGIPFFLIT